MPGAAPVEAEDELVEIVEMLAALGAVDAQRPDLEVEEEAVAPGPEDVGGHLVDDNPSPARFGSAGPRCRWNGWPSGRLPPVASCLTLSLYSPFPGSPLPSALGSVLHNAVAGRTPD